MNPCRIHAFLSLFLLFLVHDSVRGLVCDDCDPILCEEPTDCPGDVILDQCKCCFVCARVANETCGGPFDAFGRCGEGLFCYGSSKSLDTLFGVCKPKGYAPPTKANKTAQISNLLELLRTRTGHKGAGSVLKDDKDVDPCTDVRCKVVFEPRCPSDSKALHGNIVPGECCPSPPKCVCNYLECLNTVCSPGYNRVVIKKATGDPGSCCDVYECRAINDPCERVVCEDADPTFTCPSDSFKLPSIPSADGCCLVQQGCTCRPPSSCPTPSCPEGLMVQILEGASVEPGKCCDTYQCYNATWQAPILFNPEIVTAAPPHCPRMDNCTKMCVKGYDKDEKGCFACRCKPACDFKCPYGYKIDREGNPVCYCVDPPPGCMALKRCDKICDYGYKRGKNNCLKCRCNTCPFFSCPKNCTYGYELNSEGCEICKCREPPTAITPTESPEVLPPRPSIAPHMCLSKEGRVFDNGESWYDGCRHCYCHSGKEMCALITCPAVNCIHPIIQGNDCCPSCPGEDLMAPDFVPKKCFSTEGEFKTEGETWSMDKCTACICHNSNVLCEMERCLPLPCKKPVKLPGMCCPICKENEISADSVPQTNKSCSSPHGGQYRHGDTWRTNPCMSCLCRHGQIHCFSQTCPILSCNKTVLRKGQCCPYCYDLEAEGPGKCKFHEVWYDSGERWSPTECKRCKCAKGRVKCHEKVCAKLENCAISSTPPGDCCPVCTEYDEPNSLLDPLLVDKGKAELQNEYEKQKEKDEKGKGNDEKEMGNDEKEMSDEGKTAGFLPQDKNAEEAGGGQTQVTIIAILVAIIAVLSLLVLGLFIVCIRRRNRHSVDIDSVPKSGSLANLSKNQKKGPKIAEKPPLVRRPPSTGNLSLAGVIDYPDYPAPDILTPPANGMRDPHKLCISHGTGLDRGGGTTTFHSDKEYVEDPRRKLPDKYKRHSEGSAFTYGVNNKKSPQKSSDV